MIDPCPDQCALGTAGIGKQAILEFAKKNPKHIYFTGRNSSRASAVIDEVKRQTPSAELTFIQCDQASLASVERATKEFLSKSTQLDVLLCNAGIMAVPADVTQDGYEIQFQTNHLAHALFIKAFLPTIRQTAKDKGDARIVSVSSDGYNLAVKGGLDFKTLKSPQKMFFGRYIRYGRSKLANILYAAEIAERYPEITSVSLHPGVIWGTELATTLGMADQIILRAITWNKTVDVHQGASNSEWAATTDKKNLKSGAFYEPVGVLAGANAVNDKLGKELWNWTEKALESYHDSSNA